LPTVYKKTDTNKPHSLHQTIKLYSQITELNFTVWYLCQHLMQFLLKRTNVAAVQSHNKIHQFCSYETKACVDNYIIHVSFSTLFHFVPHNEDVTKSLGTI